MPDTLKDGTGSGYLAKIDNENHLHTTCSMESMIAHRSHYDASAYGISTPMLTITTTGGRMLWLQNDSDKDLYITDLRLSYNGGSTNHNRVAFSQLVFADTEPTTNITTGAAGSLNRSNVVAANMTILYWDEVGDGMTGHVAGSAGFNMCIGQGTSYFPIGGAIIVSPNKTLSFNLRGEEVGEASINLLFYFK